VGVTGFLSWNILFFALAFQPAWMQRIFAARSDDSARKAFIFLNFATLIATLPGVLLGVMISANLINKYPEGSNPYGVVLADFMNRGGFAEFVAVAGAVSAIAAIMSTADSTIISMSNLLSMDFLKNWLFVDKPDFNTPRFNFMFTKITSLIFTLIGVCVALYDKKGINDPGRGSTVYSDLLYWQLSVMWQIIPTFTVGLFMPSRAKWWACIVGIVCGFTTYGAMYAYKDDAKYFGHPHRTSFGTSFAQGNDGDSYGSKTFYLDAGVWAGFINMFLTVTLSFIPVGEDTPTSIKVITTRYGGAFARLDATTITSAMAKTVEPLKNPLGIFMAACIFMFATFSLPYYFPSYDNCDYFSYLGWTIDKFKGDYLDDYGGTYPAWAPYAAYANDECKGGVFLNGIPKWAMAIIICYAFSTICAFVMLCTYKPEDHETVSLMSMVSMQSLAPGNKEDKDQLQEVTAGALEENSPHVHT
jgi:hypothetical protein